ncbi:dynein beta chain, ciliary-like, partial [Cimex lectularius]|uniref:Dynein heavy chain tail domain-containing protein n=1 Tax=Cimex lectularius TaxID=79782 RepID=A0A8I6SAV6_CIMLE
MDTFGKDKVSKCAKQPIGDFIYIPPTSSKQRLENEASSAPTSATNFIMEGPPPPDERIDFLGNCVQKTMKLKPEKWTRLMGIEDYRNTVYDFLDSANTWLLVISQNNAAQLIPSTSFPVILKNKGAYFVKKNKGPVPKTELNHHIIYGDLATKPIEQLAILVDEIFVPLLSNKNNHKKWPSSVAQDISQHVHSLKSTVYQVRGYVAGKTVLPMPIGIDRVHEVTKNLKEENETTVDLYLKSSIEGVVIKWAIQINDVLSEESSKAFANGQNPTPNSEILFWNNRKENLQYIYDQMREDRVRKMAVILEHTESAYWPCFKDIFFNVVSALTEANEINVYLKPLEVHFGLIQETDFSDVLPCFIPLMHTVCLVWSRCKYYCNSGRIIVLLKQITNLVIEQAKKYLDPSSIFQTDIDEALQRVQLSLFILKHFRKTFDDFKDKLPTYFTGDAAPQLWTFHPNIVFERFNNFTERLQTIEKFFLTVVEFVKLERVEIGNVKGSILSAQLVDISQQFNTYFTEFSSKSYDVLNPDDKTFMDDYAMFQSNISDLDKRLASILCLAFDDCCNLEGVFKLLEIIGSFLERTLIKQEFNGKFEIILEMLSTEINTIEEIFSEQMGKFATTGHVDTDRGMPPVAGGLRWVAMLKERLNYSVIRFKALDHKISKGHRANSLYKKYDN